jgi:hypothetical protein
MTVHVIKICVGIDHIDELADWQKRRSRNYKQKLRHWTRHGPKRDEELTDGGSIYWIIKGLILVRQRVLAVETHPPTEERLKTCAFVLDPKLVPVLPAPRRPHQGWRYLETKDAPPDLTARNKRLAPPPEMAAKLRELGLL